MSDRTRSASSDTSLIRGYHLACSHRPTVADTAKDKHLPIVKGNLPNTDLGTEALWDALVVGLARRVVFASLPAMA